MSRNCTLPLILALLFSFSIPSSAQQYRVRLGEVTKEKVRPDQFILEDSSGNIYMSGLRRKMKMYLPLLLINYQDASIEKFVKKYNGNLSFVKENPVKDRLNAKKKGSKFDGRLQVTSFFNFIAMYQRDMHLETVNLWGKTYVIHAEKGKSQIDVKAIEIDVTTGRTGTEHKLLSLNTKNAASKSIDTVAVKLSPDGSKAVVFTGITNKLSGKNTGGFAATVVDQDLNTIWSKEYTLPKETRKLTYKSMDVSNDGNVYMFSKEQKNRRTAPTLTLYTLSPQSSAAERKDISFGNYVVSDAYMIMNSQSMPTVVGFYKNTPKQPTYEGILMGTIGSDGKVLISHKREFTKAYHDLVATAKEKKRLDRAQRKGKDIDEDDDYEATDLIRTEDGGLLFVAEYYVLIERIRTTSSRGVTTSSQVDYVHNYGDLIVTKLDQDGNFVFMKKIAKANAYVSIFADKIYPKDYNLQMLKDNYYFFFNDEPKAKANTHGRNSFQSAWNAATYAVKVTPSGDIDKDLIMDKKRREGYTFDPSRDMMRLSNDKLAFMMVKGRGFGRKTRMGTIAIN